MRRFFEDREFERDVPTELSAQTAHHLVRVLRAQPGDELVLFNGRGGQWHARVETVEKKRVSVVPLAFSPEDRTPPVAVTVALPLIKGERMDVALQKATELGAAGFQLLITARTEMRLDEQRLMRKMQHWQGVVNSACEQCGLNRVPRVSMPRMAESFLNDQRPGLKLIARAGGEPLRNLDATGAESAVLLTGPEGGFSDHELELAARSGYRAVTLGQRTLRAETAPAAILAGLWTLLE